MNKVTAYANANIALIKYWGKNEYSLNIPLMSSLSVTLDNLGTTTTVELCDKDSLFINDQEEKDLEKISNFLNYIRNYFHIKQYFLIKSYNNIPTAAGLASSASSYASITLALNNLLKLNLNNKELSLLARIGSASAARSILGGFNLLYGAKDYAHEQAYAKNINSNNFDDLTILIVLCDTKSKKVSSSKGMLTAKSSAFFETFVKQNKNDIKQSLIAIKNKDFISLGKLSELSTLKMHSVMLTSDPCLIYWNEKTLRVIKKIQNLREKYGYIAFFSIDAGANVKIFCLNKTYISLIKKELSDEFLDTDFFLTGIGKAAYVQNS